MYCMYVYVCSKYLPMYVYVVLYILSPHVVHTCIVIPFQLHQLYRFEWGLMVGKQTDLPFLTT